MFHVFNFTVTPQTKKFNGEFFLNYSINVDEF